MFDKIKDMYRLQKQAKEAKKKLKNIQIEASQDGFTVIMDGEMEVLSIAITDELLAKAVQNKKDFEEIILKCFNKCLKKAQQIAAEEMKGLMGEMGLGM
ncbi:YbaB/EbfC family nucleoid-associated protein [Candidatus Peregrinibacteria bacterium]|nr:YbaB/EbfC family nucleoid-associated protein [Candidatus Peregrinibacteria bacterium]